MVNKSLRTIDSIVAVFLTAFGSYSASQESPCGAVSGIDYIQVRAVPPLVSISKQS